MLDLSSRRLWAVTDHIARRLAGPGMRASCFGRPHADAIIACDFCVVASASFRILYVLVVMEHASRRIVHINVTAHPTAAWTLQQLREAIPSDHTYRFIVHDRDAIFSTGLDASRTWASKSSKHPCAPPRRIRFAKG
jgi:putative transposase